jgi:hypothetical protein
LYRFPDRAFEAPQARRIGLRAASARMPVSVSIAMTIATPAVS